MMRTCLIMAVAVAAWSQWVLELAAQPPTFQGPAKSVTHVEENPGDKTSPITNTDKTAKPRNGMSVKKKTTLVFDKYPGVEKSTLYWTSWSPDGKSLAAASYDGTVKLWFDVATDHERVAVMASQKTVYCVSWSPDGKTLATASKDKTVKLWDVAMLGKIARRPDDLEPLGEPGATDAAPAKEKSTFRGHTEVVYCVSWSPDGKTLASASADKTVKLWDVATSKVLATLEGHADDVFCVSWSPDGKTLASASFDSTVKLWDAVLGKGKATLTGSCPICEVGVPKAHRLG